MKVSRIRWFSRPLPGFLAACLALLTVAGCGKVEQYVNKKKQEEKRAQRELEDRKQELKLQYEEAIRQGMAAVPPFDRDAARDRLLMERYKFDIDKFFPKGYDPEKLMTREDVEALARQKLEATVQGRFPDATRERFLEEAAKMYPLYKVGDEVTVTLGNRRKVSGKITAMGGRVVEINGGTVRIEDIIDPSQGCFNAEKNANLRRVYMNKKFDLARNDFVKQAKAQVIPATFQQCAFVRVGGKWIRIDAIIEKQIMPMVDKLEQDYLAQKEEDVRIAAQEALTPEERDLLWPPDPELVK